MRAFLEVINGRYAGTTHLVETGEVCTVGARHGADVFLPNDSRLAPLHFVVKNEAETCVLEKADGEIFVNNQPFETGELAHGDFIFAGETLFQLTVDGEKTSDETVLGKLIERVCRIENLFLLIDENQDRRILPILQEHDASFRELKKDQKGFEAITANPLVVITKDNRRLIETLVRAFWGKGFLVFFKSSKNRFEIIENLRFLLEKTQLDDGTDCRFYDARMLRIILSRAEDQTAQSFFDAADTYFIESQLPSHLFRFILNKGKVAANLIRLSPETPKIPTQTEIKEFLKTENARGDLSQTSELCLSHFLPDYKNEIRNAAQASLPLVERFQIKSAAAKIQFVALNAIFGAEFGENAEIVELFESKTYPADAQMLFLVERLNRNRG